jgi:hypothetical protein
MVRGPVADTKKLPVPLARNATSKTRNDPRRSSPSGIATVTGPWSEAVSGNVSLGAPSCTATGFRGVIVAVWVQAAKVRRLAMAAVVLISRPDCKDRIMGCALRGFMSSTFDNSYRIGNPLTPFFAPKEPSEGSQPMSAGIFADVARFLRATSVMCLHHFVSR